jgi:hypothetical protein
MYTLNLNILVQLRKIFLNGYKVASGGDLLLDLIFEKIMTEPINRAKASV